MSKKVKVISFRNVSRRMPLHGTLTAWLSLKVFEAPEWIWGAVGVLFLILWLLFIYRCVKEDEVFVDVFTGEETDVYGKTIKNEQPIVKKSFEERLAEKREEQKNGVR